MGRPIINLLNKTIGHLTVIAQTDQRRHESVVWLCRCTCGKQKLIAASSLARNISTSCGCQPDQKNRRRANGTGATNKSITLNYFNITKRGAINRGYEFSISLQEFGSIITRPCYYCGKKDNQLRMNSHKSCTYILKACGIDRVNNQQGYIFANCVSSCFTCNKMKSTLGVKEFLDHIRRISNHWEGKELPD